MQPAPAMGISERSYIAVQPNLPQQPTWTGAEIAVHLILEGQLSKASKQVGAWK